MKTLTNIALLLTIVVVSIIGCKKDEMSSTSSELTGRKAATGCTVLPGQASFIRVINPNSAPGWFTGPCYPSNFDFSDGYTGALEPVIYSNKDTMNVTIKIHVGQVVVRNRGYVDDQLDNLYCEYLYQGYPPVAYPQHFTFSQGPGDYIVTVNANLIKLGLGNNNINFDYQGGFTNLTSPPDTNRYNYDIYDFNIRSAKTNQYTSSRFVVQSDKH